MWEIILILAGNVFVAGLGWWTRRMFRSVSAWVMGGVMVFLGLGVIPIAASETWREIVLHGTPTVVWISLAALVAGVVIGALACRFQLRVLRREIDEAQAKLVAKTQPPASPVAVDYLQACAIVNGYIDPDGTMRDRTRLSVRTAILQRFESVVGAKIGENYNGEVLHQWMQKNAARILVENLGKMI